ncbi:uncharacterized protein LOC129916001 [Episyrphus balteatus]|uniref:uncharacterized protein LOC129916001 n=1 Tax=Episyrphus balteatus TaxID=286459 RepID=UPI002485E8D5|nr:uncharacterized protein LOC129916001 [Episyrphus balteatus]
MSMNNLTVDGEFRYIIQWFNEWSELQRDDFVPILVDYLTRESSGVYVNGVVSGLANAEVIDKPMSLFQCRIKLFKEWSPKWPEEMKNRLKEKIIEMDSKVAEKIICELKSASGVEVTTNGISQPEESAELANGNNENVEEPNEEAEVHEYVSPPIVANEEVPPVA